MGVHAAPVAVPDSFKGSSVLTKHVESVCESGAEMGDCVFPVVACEIASWPWVGKGTASDVEDLDIRSAGLPPMNLPAEAAFEGVLGRV